MIVQISYSLPVFQLMRQVLSWGRSFAQFPIVLFTAKRLANLP